MTKRAIVISHCGQCPHSSHSGCFTKGGPWPVCHGPGVVSWSEMSKTLDYNDPDANEKWSPPIIPVNTKQDRQMTGEIPDWCPLTEWRES